MTPLPETAPGVVVWCLSEGMSVARLVVQDENGGPSAARTLELGDLTALRKGLDIAIERATKAYCQKEGHFRMASLGPICMLCGASDDTQPWIPTLQEPR